MKPLRPFPLPIQVGTDICQISRVYGILRGPRRARFLDRILTPEELAQSDGRLRADAAQVQPAPRSDAPPTARDGDGSGFQGEGESRGPLWASAAFLAGRFAAKEAAIKAHPHRNLTFHDVVIERAPAGARLRRLGSGPPVLRIKAGEGETEDSSALISISHDGDYATAVCIAHDPSRGPAGDR
ncbi:hypothetical protein RJ55_08076 [Drechmeria coniospora]|nr:hypothetical protein RJ55_08076 [Drechmeria coniospora]